MKKNREMTCLKNLYNALKNTKLPSFSGDDQLDEWIEELIEVDALLSGLACSILAGEIVVRKQIPEINTLKKTFIEVNYLNTINQNILNQCQQYLDLLLRMHKQILISIE